LVVPFSQRVAVGAFWIMPRGFSRALRAEENVHALTSPSFEPQYVRAVRIYWEILNPCYVNTNILAMMK
jgi:hypothetical protein